MKKLGFLLVICVISLSSCALFKRDRVRDNTGIKLKEFNLPVFFYPTKDSLSKKLVILFSGDGGWVKFEDNLAIKFAENGFYTVGINSRDYFWEQRNPEETGIAIAMLMRKYAIQYHTHQIYLCGYSFGADVVPFIYNNLPHRAKRHVMALEMLSPYATTAFKVRFADLTNLSGDNYSYKVDMEVKKLNVPIFCFYGVNENEKPLGAITQTNFRLGSLVGDHHYEESEYDKIVAVLKSK